MSVLCESTAEALKVGCYAVCPWTMCGTHTRQDKPGRLSKLIAYITHTSACAPKGCINDLQHETALPQNNTNQQCCYPIPSKGPLQQKDHRSLERFTERSPRVLRDIPREDTGL
jgi:hypothetical protein